MDSLRMIFLGECLSEEENVKATGTGLCVRKEKNKWSRFNWR